MKTLSLGKSKEESAGMARNTGNVLSTAVDVTDHQAACASLFALEAQKRPAYVCFATAHLLVEAKWRRDIGDIYRQAAFVSPDGMPVMWCLRALGHWKAQCVSGPTLTPVLLREAERRGVAVGFYGGRPETLAKLQAAVAAQYPALRITYAFSPPFREQTEAECAGVQAAIRASGAGLLFIGLGSIKQDLWMARNHAALDCVCLGVGAVFEFLSGEKRLPSLAVQSLGLAWLARLWQEPRRLARRNLYSPIFATLFSMQLAQSGVTQCMRLLSSAAAGAGRGVQ